MVSFELLASKNDNKESRTKRNERIIINTKVSDEEKTESWACLSAVGCAGDWEVGGCDEFLRGTEEEVRDSQAPMSMNPPPATVWLNNPILLT